MKALSMALLLFTMSPLALLASDNNDSKIQKEEPTKEKNIQTLDSKIIIGATEMIKITPPKITLKARIDTGATTTSIDARNITAFERDSKKWVKFSIFEGKKEHKMERPVSRTITIKRHGTEAQERFVIQMRVTAGDITQLIDVSLTDRSNYEYPILIGRNFLKDYFIVDVSGSNLLSKKKK